MGWRDTLDILKDKTMDLAQAGVAQSKRLAEIARLKACNLSEEETIKKAYIEMGKLYYAEKNAVAEGPYAGLCEKVTAAKAAIEVNNERIAALREDQDDDQEAPAAAAESPAAAPAEAPAAEPAEVSAEDIADGEAEPKTEA